MADGVTGFPIHQKPDGHWYVSLGGDPEWLRCRDEQEALALAMSPVLEQAAIDKQRSGDEFARELNQVADGFESHGFIEDGRRLRAFAAEAKKKP